MQRTTVLLLFGGESSEHEVSISSARNVYAAMDDTKFDVVLCFIDKNGHWWLLDELTAQIDTSQAPQLVAALGSRSFLTLPGNKVVSPDVILPILHGKNGEDGAVQGLAQLLHIPIVGSGVVASALGWDKLATKKITSAHGVRVVPHAIHHQDDELPDFSGLVLTLGRPLFVKPTRSGSSVGVNRVDSEDELKHALEEAHKHHKVALIEHAVEGRELEVAVLGTKPHHRVSGVGEVLSGDAFYSYDDKYASDSTAKVIIPADVPENITKEIKATAKEIYELLHCSGLARVDFFLSNDGTLYFNEINTMPGFTNISMYPKLWRHEGIGYPKLIEHLIDDALAK